MDIQKFFASFILPFQFLGFANPLKQDGNWYKFIEVIKIIKITLTAAIYYTGICYVVQINLVSSDKISIVSNYCQFGINAIAATMITIVPYINISMYKLTIDTFRRIDDDQMLGYKNYKKDLTLFYKIFASWGVIFTGIAIYDYYVTCYIMQFPSWYYCVSYYPILIINCGIIQVDSYIYFTWKRFQVMKKYIDNLLEKEDNKNKNGAEMIEMGNIDTGCTMEIDLKHIFYGISALAEVVVRIEKLYGPIFITTFAALFTTIAIQLYYITYIIIFFNDVPYLLVLSSILLVVFNTILISVTAHQCDKVTTYVR